MEVNCLQVQGGFQLWFENRLDLYLMSIDPLMPPQFLASTDIEGCRTPYVTPSGSRIGFAPRVDDENTRLFVGGL